MRAGDSGPGVREVYDAGQRRVRPLLSTAAAPVLLERDWQRQVTDLAEHLGWMWCHFRPARTEQGWRTPVAGPGGRGFPDLVMWRERVIYAELKTERGKVAGSQRMVLLGLRAAGAEVYLWRPSDWDEVVAVLTRRGA